MKQSDVEAADWVTALLDAGDGPINPQVLTQTELREFVWWLVRPGNFRRFRAMLQARNRGLAR